MEKNEGKTVCDQGAMLGYWLMLTDIIMNLQEGYEKAAGLKDIFDGCYQGEAKEEVMIFLESLPLHIYRLSLMYSKLAEFTSTTAESLFNNDTAMAENMEG